MQDVESDQPEDSDRERVQRLGYNPVLERSSGGAQVVAKVDDPLLVLRIIPLRTLPKMQLWKMK